MTYRSSGTIAAVLIFTIVLLAGCATTMEQRADWIAQRIIAELDLTKDQQNSVRQITIGFFQKLNAQKEDRIRLNDDFAALVKSDAVDQAKLDQLWEKMNGLDRELEDFITQKFTDFHKTLTPAQKEKAAKWAEKASEEMKSLFFAETNG